MQVEDGEEDEEAEAHEASTSSTQDRGENGGSGSALGATNDDNHTMSATPDIALAGAAAPNTTVEPAIACDQCAFWVHPHCEGFSLEVYHRISLDQEPSLVDGFLCPACRPAKIGSLVQKLEEMDLLYLFAEPVVRRKECTWCVFVMWRACDGCTFDGVPVLHVRAQSK